MTNTTNVITLTMTKEETAILSSVLRHLSMDLGERIADAGKDEPHLTREALDALTGHMEVELGCVNRLAATLDDADDHDPDCGRNIPGGGGRHPLCESCLEDEEDLVKKAQFAMDHGTIEHPGNATKAEIVEAFQQAMLLGDDVSFAELHRCGECGEHWESAEEAESCVHYACSDKQGGGK